MKSPSDACSFAPQKGCDKLIVNMPDSDHGVGPKAISLSFDDNKTYVAMFLIILFNLVSG